MIKRKIDYELAPSFSHWRLIYLVSCMLWRCCMIVWKTRIRTYASLQTKHDERLD